MLFLLVHLLVVKEILWEEADDLVAILNPELDGDLDTLTREKFVLAMPHRDILGIKNDKRLFSLHQGLTGLVLIVDFSEQIVHLGLRRRLYNTIAFRFLVLRIRCLAVADVSLGAP